MPQSPCPKESAHATPRTDDGLRAPLHFGHQGGCASGQLDGAVDLPDSLMELGKLDIPKPNLLLASLAMSLLGYHRQCEAL